MEHDPIPFYEWEAKGKSGCVRLGLPVVDRLGLAVREASVASQPRAVELGGLLLGRLKHIRGAAVVEIEDFEPVECEHAAGPSYFLSNADRNGLARRMRRRKASGGMSIVGFYRSNTRKEFAVTVEDIDLMLDYFAKPWMVLLMIDAPPRAPLTAGFFIWEERGIRTNRPYLEFPFDRAQLMVGGRDLHERPPATRLWPEARPSREWRLPVVSPGAELRKLSQALRLAKWPAGLASALRLPAPPTWTDLRRRLRRPVPETIAAFLSEPRNHGKIAWVAMGAILAGAMVGGVLARHPAEASAPVPLTALRARPHETEPAVDVAPTRMDAAAEIPPPADWIAPLVPRARPVKAARARKTEYRERRAADLLAPARGVRAALAPAPPLPEAPEIAAAPAPDADLLWHESGVPAPTIPHAEDPFVSVALDTPASPGHSGLLGKLHLARNHRGAFEPPTLVHEAPVHVPMDLRNRIQHAVTIQVKLYLNRAGKVQYAELLSNGTGANRDIAALAVFSSRRCQFSPARVGDETIPAEVVLRYRFGPAGSPEAETLRR